MNKRVAVIFVALFVFVTTVQVENHATNVQCANLFDCSMTNEVSMTCDTTQLLKIPECTENLETLIVRSGIIQRLYNFDFPPTMSTLRVLVVKNVFLKQMQSTTFENLYNLVELDLSENFLRKIDPELLINNWSLERLNFSSNMIRKLVASQFPLPNLKTLDLSNCNLELVDEAAFLNTTALQWLNLRTNKLKTIAFQIKVSIILLSKNPLNCDCLVYRTLKTYATDESTESSGCMDAERNQVKMWNDTNLWDSICEEEIRKNTNTNANASANKSKKEREREREDNAAPDLMITIYGYVFVALSALICVCVCCCRDKPRRRKISNFS